MNDQMMYIIGAILLFVGVIYLHKKDKLGGAVAFVLGIGGVMMMGLFFALLLALPTMWLWDFVMPYLFKVPEITLGRAFCLLLLSHLLFGGTSKSKKE